MNTRIYRLNKWIDELIPRLIRDATPEDRAEYRKILLALRKERAYAWQDYIWKKANNPIL